MRPGSSALAVIVALIAPAEVTTADTHGARAAAPTVGRIEVVESAPSGTTLGLPNLRKTAAVWAEMLQGARASVEVGAFYLSDDPGQGDPLDLILEEVVAAAGRGARVRVVNDAGMARTYLEIPERLEAIPRVAVRPLDARRLWGGVMHAKYLLVDERELFLGSQNWDWRALDHIRELGVRVEHPGLAADLDAVFNLDWALAVGEADEGGAPEPDSLSSMPSGALRGESALLVTSRGDTVVGRFAASPPQALPPGIPWDEPLLVALLDGARETIRVQLLSYSPMERRGAYYDALDTALRRAAARGVAVRIVLANWSKRANILPYLQSLAALPNVEIRFTNIPEAASGFIPYARVDHAKYAIADSAACWIGTANWSGDYFHSSRNVSLFVNGEPGNGVAADVAAFFAQSWNSPYAEEVSPCGAYTAPRIGE